MRSERSLANEAGLFVPQTLLSLFSTRSMTPRSRIGTLQLTACTAISRSISAMCLYQRAFRCSFAIAVRSVVRPGSGHDVDAAVDVDRLSAHAPGIRRRQVGAGIADVHDVDELAERR